MLREYLSNIADKFRTYLDTTEPINAQDFAGTIEDVAVRYNQLGFTSGREVGYNQGLEECQSKHFVGTVTGSGTQSIDIPIPFYPDLIYINADGGTGLFTSTIRNLNFNLGAFGRFCGALYFTDNTTSTFANMSLSGALSRTKYENGILNVDIKATQYNTRFNENTLYSVICFKFNNTLKERVINEVNALPNESNGEALQYSEVAINSNFTTEEWESLIATKPNWTFLLR